MRIGSYELAVPVALAPMAGITDKPFRQLCRRFGAAWATGEMLTSNPALQHTRQSRYRADHGGEDGVHVVQIAGSNPQQMADAARFNVARGAQVIDINMGCPAKKVCQVAAGSALLQNEALVAAILQAVVRAVAVPVTLKTRLGWDEAHENIITIAQLAADAGIAAMAIHGRTRTQMYRGAARYEKIAEVKRMLSMPVWVNGDLTCPQQAWQVCADTGADGVMIGRSAQGQPWLFRDLVHYRHTGQLPEALSVAEHAAVVATHIGALHAFYGDEIGLRIARKHIGWYVSALPGGDVFRRQANQADTAGAQRRQLDIFLNQQVAQLTAWPCDYRAQTQQAA